MNEEERGSLWHISRFSSPASNASTFLSYMSVRKEGLNMTAKEYLQQVKEKDKEINNLMSDKKALIEMMYSLGGSGEGDGERVQTSRNNDKFGTLYSRIDEKERKIIEKINELVDFKLKVSEEINALSDARYIAVLHKRHIRFQSWERIAVDLGYTVRHVQNLNGQALIEFKKKYQCMLEKCNSE